MRKGQKKRVWTVEQKLEIVHKHLDEHISVKQFADDIDALPDAAFQDLEAKWQSFRVDDFDPSYAELRNKVIAVYQESKPNGGYS